MVIKAETWMWNKGDNSGSRKVKSFLLGIQQLGDGFSLW
jgi:hypothetical protein